MSAENDWVQDRRDSKGAGVGRAGSLLDGGSSAGRDGDREAQARWAGTLVADSVNIAMFLKKRERKDNGTGCTYECCFLSMVFGEVQSGLTMGEGVGLGGGGGGLCT